MLPGRGFFFLERALPAVRLTRRSRRKRFTGRFHRQDRRFSNTAIAQARPPACAGP